MFLRREGCGWVASTFYDGGGGGVSSAAGGSGGVL